jgi:hypothetical protein
MIRKKGKEADAPPPQLPYRYDGPAKVAGKAKYAGDFSSRCRSLTSEALHPDLIPLQQRNQARRSPLIFLRDWSIFQHPEREQIFD